MHYGFERPFGPSCLKPMAVISLRRWDQVLLVCSLGFADPKAGIAFGYVMNKRQFVEADAPLTPTLIAAVHESLQG